MWLSSPWEYWGKQSSLPLHQILTHDYSPPKTFLLQASYDRLHSPSVLAVALHWFCSSTSISSSNWGGTELGPPLHMFPPTVRSKGSPALYCWQVSASCIPGCCCKGALLAHSWFDVHQFPGVVGISFSAKLISSNQPLLTQDAFSSGSQTQLSLFSALRY